MDRKKKKEPKEPKEKKGKVSPQGSQNDPLEMSGLKKKKSKPRNVWDRLVQDASLRELRPERRERERGKSPVCPSPGRKNGHSESPNVLPFRRTNTGTLDATQDGKGQRVKKIRKFGSLRGTQMCPTCGSVVSRSKILANPSEEVMLGNYGINSGDLEIDMGTVLGKGGFGVVYLGSYQATEVAVKMMFADRVDTDDINEWKREVSIMTRLRHPNILMLLGAVFEERKFAIVTEYCNKGTLRKVVREVAKGARLEVTWGRKLDWLHQVAKGMAFLHHKKIHHRDLKASNVFISGETMKIADFGLSKIITTTDQGSKRKHDAPEAPSQGGENTGAAPSSSSAPKGPDEVSNGDGASEAFSDATPSGGDGDASGTFAFVAPEVWKGEPFIDASDVYSFGCMMIEVCTTRVPFDDVEEEDEDLWARRIRRGYARPVMPPLIGGEAVPDSIIDISKKCLSYKAKERPTFLKLVEIFKAEMDEPYTCGNAPAPYESDDDEEEMPVDECDTCSDESPVPDAEGWSRGEY